MLDFCYKDQMANILHESDAVRYEDRTYHG
jgi:hypothetical protein